MAERSIHNVFPFRVTNYVPSNRGSLIGFTTTATIVNRPECPGFIALLLRVHPTDGDLLVEVSDGIPATAVPGSYRVTENQPEWIQLTRRSVCSIRSVSGGVNAALTWAG